MNFPPFYIILFLILFPNIVQAQPFSIDSSYADCIVYYINTKGVLVSRDVINEADGSREDSIVTHVVSFERDTLITRITRYNDWWEEVRTFYIPWQQVEQVSTVDRSNLIIKMQKGAYIDNTVRVLSKGGLGWENYGHDFLITRLKMYGSDSLSVKKLADTFVKASYNRIKYITDSEIKVSTVDIPKVEIAKSMEEAQRIASETNKQILLLFTTYAGNSKSQTWQTLKIDEVNSKLSKDFVLLELITDDRTPLKEKQYTADGKEILTVGQLNLNFQKSEFEVNAQPYCVILNSKLQRVGMPEFYVSPEKVNKFLYFLNQ